MNSDPRGTFVFQTWRVSAPPHRPRGQISSSPLLCRDVSPRVTHPVWWTHTQTHTHIITHKHTLSLKPSAPPHPTTSLAFDYMSGDVYGPLFAVLMIIVTGWFHYQELSDGWVPTLTSTDTGVLDHWGRRNEQRSGGFMKGGQLGAELYHLFMFPIHWKHVSLSDVQVADWRSDEAQMEQKYFLDLLVDKGNLWNLRMKLDS